MAYLNLKPNAAYNTNLSSSIKAAQPSKNPVVTNYYTAPKTFGAGLNPSAGPILPKGAPNPSLYTGGSAAPSTGGQAAAPTGGGGVNNDYLSTLSDAFKRIAGDYSSQLGSYDSDYSNMQNATNAQIQSATDTKAQQDQADQVLYGQNLKNLLQSNNELNQRRQGTFSALGTLDSSAFQQDQTKGDQALLDNQQQLGTQRDNALHTRENVLNQYVNDARTKLSAYGNEIERAKAGLRQAIANNDINQAGAVQTYLQNLQTQQAQLAALAPQGASVVSQLGGTNINDYSTQLAQQLQQQQAANAQKYQVPTNGATGSGFIGFGSGLLDNFKKMLGMQ